jgi:hypothetical protein
VHASTEDKSDDTKEIFYEELERVFHQFPEYYIKILFGDFGAKVGIFSHKKTKYEFTCN